MIEINEQEILAAAVKKRQEGKTVTDILAAAIEKNETYALNIFSTVKEQTASLSQVDSVMVKKMVVAADNVSNSIAYCTDSIGEVKYIASFETIPLAIEGDLTKAKTITEYQYPDADTILIIERR